MKIVLAVVVALAVGGCFLVSDESRLIGEWRIGDAFYTFEADGDLRITDGAGGVLTGIWGIEGDGLLYLATPVGTPYLYDFPSDDLLMLTPKNGGLTLTLVRVLE